LDPQEFGFLDPDPDWQKYPDPRGKISTKTEKNSLSKLQSYF